MERNKRTKEEDDGWTLVLERRARPWADLPSSALLNIFCKTYFNDRLVNIPLVCRSWRSVLDHPHCWSSMLPDSISPEDAFIRIIYRSLYRRKVIYHPKRFEMLIERAGGGSAITCLYLEPFFCSTTTIESRRLVSQLFRLIANSCPNLKHISFHGFGLSYYIDGLEDVLEIFRRCKRLELVDFCDSRQLDSPAVIQEMGNHLPLLRGIRIMGWRDYDVADCIAKYLPWLKFLSLYEANLSVVLSNCLNLQYLNVSFSRDCQELVDQASARITEFQSCGYLRYEDDDDYKDNGDNWSLCSSCWPYGWPGYYRYCGSPLSDVERCQSDYYEWYDDQYYLFKDERSDAFFQSRAKDQRRRERKFLKGCMKDCNLQRRSKCKPVTEYKLAYANDLFVVPVRR